MCFHTRFLLRLIFINKVSYSNPNPMNRIQSSAVPPIRPANEFAGYPYVAWADIPARTGP